MAMLQLKRMAKYTALNHLKQEPKIGYVHDSPLISCLLCIDIFHLCFLSKIIFFCFKL